MIASVWRIANAKIRAAARPQVIAAVIAVFFVVTATIGGIRSYSPVPFSDMWDGELDFYLQLLQGHYLVWWEQHNEHRIVLARVLFWIDFRLFGGTAAFLVAANYGLLALLVVLLWVLLCARLSSTEDRNPRILLGLVIVSLMSSWIQRENLIWGFQSQFILGQLLPLLGFYCLYRAAEQSRNTFRWFTGACVSGAFSLGTIASGVLALPLLLLTSMVMRLSWNRRAVLAALAVLGTAAYFHGYVTPSQHGSVLSTLTRHPQGFLQYVLTYIGGLFYYCAGGGKQIAILAGSSFIVFCCWQLWRVWPRRKQEPLTVCLLGFLLYIGGTAFGTAGGRFLLGIEAATSERYMTPVLCAWCVLLILSAPWWASKFSRNAWIVSAALLSMPLSLIPHQLHAIESADSLHFDRRQAALALELNVQDGDRIRSVFPAPDVAIEIARRASDKDISVFGMAPYKGLSERMGTLVPSDGAPPCEGSLDVHADVGNADRRVLRITGWLVDADSGLPPDGIDFLNDQRALIGFGLTGLPRADVVLALRKKESRKSGFSGYVLNVPTNGRLILRGESPRCEMNLQGIS